MQDVATIPLMLYDVREDGNTTFYFSHVPIIETLLQLSEKYSIKELKLMASGGNPWHYIYYNDIIPRDTINDLTTFFITNPEYSIDDADIFLQNSIHISVHDDAEIQFVFPKGYDYKPLIKKILTHHQFDANKVLSYLTVHKNQYLSVLQPDVLVKSYADFDEYKHEVVN